MAHIREVCMHTIVASMPMPCDFRASAAGLNWEDRLGSRTDILAIAPANGVWLVSSTVASAGGPLLV